MAAGDYTKTTYINGSPPALSAANLNNNENKTAEIDSLLALHLADSVKHITSDERTSWNANVTKFMNLKRKIRMGTF